MEDDDYEDAENVQKAHLRQYYGVHDDYSERSSGMVVCCGSRRPIAGAATAFSRPKRGIVGGGSANSIVELALIELAFEPESRRNRRISPSYYPSKCSES